MCEGNNNPFINYLKEQRQKKNLTQEQVAERMQVSTATMSAIERGKIEIDIRMCMELAGIFEVPVVDILRFWEM
ncbi:MAG: helix-turn-helix transcriptional regulator [Thermoflexaceae bacterium]|nr:helix-turn-helix transcriptional regulator [Thermoflexaceae bacterium]